MCAATILSKPLLWRELVLDHQFLLTVWMIVKPTEKKKIKIYTLFFLKYGWLSFIYVFSTKKEINIMLYNVFSLRRAKNRKYCKSEHDKWFESAQAFIYDNLHHSFQTTKIMFSPVKDVLVNMFFNCFLFCFVFILVNLFQAFKLIIQTSKQITPLEIHTYIWRHSAVVFSVC